MLEWHPQRLLGSHAGMLPSSPQGSRISGTLVSAHLTAALVDAVTGVALWAI